MITSQIPQTILAGILALFVTHSAGPELATSIRLPTPTIHASIQSSQSQALRHQHSIVYQCLPVQPSPTATPTPQPTPVVSTHPTPQPSATPTAPVPSPTHVPTSTPTPIISPSSTPTPTSTQHPTPTPQDQTILLTEVMPAPTTPSPEWIEVYNPTDTAVDLSGWYIDDLANAGSSPQALSGIVEPHTFLVIELKSAIFNNSGDDVRLLDAAGRVVLETSYTTSSSAESWGIDMTSMLYCAQPPTPAATNTTLCTNPEPTSTPTPTPKPSSSPQPTSAPSPTPIPTVSLTPTPTTQVTTSSQVFISEFLPRPATGSSEWVELYNDSSTSVSLDGWYIDDIGGGGSAPKRIDSVTVAPHTYTQIPLTSAILNNDADSVRLLNPSQQAVDELRYEDAEAELSFSRQSYTNQTICKTSPTPAQENAPCIDIEQDSFTQSADASALTEPSQRTDTITPSPSIISATTADTAGEIQGLSTYRPPSKTALRTTTTPSSEPPHTTSRLALSLASLSSSATALFLFFKKIKPW